MDHYAQRNGLTHALLAVVAIGGVTLIALLAPNAFQVLGRRDNWWSRREAKRKRIREALDRLRRRRLITYEEKGKETYIKITKEGKSIVRKFEFDEMRLPSVPRWDQKWRLVIFDIPETKARHRKILQEKLTSLGFRQLQKSVLVYPYDCRDEIDFVTAFLEISPWVLYLETDNLSNQEGKIRNYFSLL